LSRWTLLKKKMVGLVVLPSSSCWMMLSSGSMACHRCRICRRMRRVSGYFSRFSGLGSHVIGRKVRGPQGEMRNVHAEIDRRHGRTCSR